MIINVHEGVRFGVGLDRLTEDVRGEAIAYDGSSDQSGGQRVTADVVMIETQEALMESLNISVGASVHYGAASVDASMNFAQSHAVNEHTLYLLLKAQITNPPKNMIGARLTDQAAAVYARDPEEFRRLYGDVYVDELYGGGNFYGLFMFETRDERSKTELSAELHASIGGFLAGGEISASFSSTVENFKGKTNMSIKVQMSGGSGLDNPKDLDELKELYQHFNAAVRDHPLDCQASVKDFKYLPLPPGPSWIENVVRQDTIETCGRYVIDALSRRSTIDFILKYPEQFEWPEGGMPQVDALVSYRSQLNERIPKWARRATACTDDVGQCLIGPDEQQPVSPTLPKRKADSDPLEAKWQDIVHHDERAGAYFQPNFLFGTLQDDYERGPRGGRYKIFKSSGSPVGGIFWQPDVGAFVVYGGIFAAYLQRELCNGPLGYPRSDEEFYGDQDRVSHFENGVLWWDHGTATISGIPKPVLIRLSPLGRDVVWNR